MPREHEAVLLLGQVAAYLAAWAAPLKAVAARFAAAAERWADDLEASASEASPADAKPVRAKQCLLRTTALLCTCPPGVALETEDARRALRLAVLVCHGQCHGSGTPLEERLQELKVRREGQGGAACAPPALAATRLCTPVAQVLCNWTMARHADALVAIAMREPWLVTEALRCVLQRAPKVLEWRRLASDVQAVGSDGRLYCVNLLTGTVLEDGAPPGRLPLEVTQHNHYLRTFGRWEFEVTVTCGTRRTIAPVDGRFYEFWVTKSGGLHVVEEEAETGLRLELLDASEGSWSGELPLRLRELHSHWLSR